MYKLFLTLRYLRKRRIAYFAIAAVMLCTAMVLVVMSVMGGFLDQLKTKARGLLGDIIIDNRYYSGFPLYEAFITEVSQWPEILKATPVLYSDGLLRFPNTAQVHRVRVVGMRLDDVYAVNAFKASLYYEKYYPGTTTLAPQQQPLLGFDVHGPDVPWIADGQTLGDGPRPLLPATYDAALQQSWDAGVRDTDSPDNDWAPICRAAGAPVIVGQYQPPPLGAVEPPRMEGDALPGIIIGRDIVARRMQDGRYERYAAHPRGRVAVLTVVPVSREGTILDPIKPAFRYADDSRTGIYEIDSQHAYCDFDTLQRLLRMDAAPRIDPLTGQQVGTDHARCSQIQIKIAPDVDPHKLARRLQEHYRVLLRDPRFTLDEKDRELLSNIEALTWEQSQAHMIAPIEKERQLVTILFGLISLVAAVLVLCILYMIVLQKTRDIGIVKSIGGSSAGVALIFVTYGAAVGLVGSGLGLILGHLFVTYINEIQAFLQYLNPAWQVWNREVYSFDEIPNTVRTWDMAVVFVAAILASTVGSLLAAWRASTMLPVEALRHE